MYSFILVYQVVKYFGLYIATWEYSSRGCKCTLSLVSKGESWLWCILTCCHPCLSTVVRDWLSKWEWVGDESESQATSACWGIFVAAWRIFDIWILFAIACAAWCNWFHHFFLGRRHGQVVRECERCSLIFETSSVLDVSLIWISPQSQLGWHPNQSSLLPHSPVQPSSEAVAARLFDVGRYCCSTGDCGNSPCSHGMGGAPSATLTKIVCRFGVDFFS